MLFCPLDINEKLTLVVRAQPHCKGGFLVSLSFKTDHTWIEMWMVQQGAYTFLIPVWAPWGYRS